MSEPFQVNGINVFDFNGLEAGSGSVEVGKASVLFLCLSFSANFYSYEEFNYQHVEMKTVSVEEFTPLECRQFCSCQSLKELQSSTGFNEQVATHSISIT